MNTPPSDTRARWGIAVATPLIGAAVLEQFGTLWPARPWVAAGLAIAALAALALGGVRLQRRGWRAALPEALALGVAAMLAPAPWSWLLTAGAGVTLIAEAPGGGVMGRSFARLAGAARCLVLAALPAAAVAGLLTMISLSAPTADWMAAPLAAAMGCLGFASTPSQGLLAGTTIHSGFAIPMILSNLGWLPAAALVAAVLGLRVFAGLPPSRGEAARLLILASAAWVAGMVVSLALLFQIELFLDFESHTRPMGFLAHPTFRMLLMSPLAVPLLGLWMPARGGARTKRPIGPLSRVAAAALAAAALVSGFLVHFEERGERKHGRVLIDEAHSGWEAVAPPYTTDWYGYDSGYNYAVIADYIGHFYDVAVPRGAIDAAALRDVDVLLVKTPTRGYSPEERAAVVEFVRRGGGLLLVGEHTNVWGSGFYLNTLARPLGFEFRYDVVFDLRRTFEEDFARPPIGHHPILAGMRKFLYAVSCSIRPMAAAVRPVMWSSGLWSLEADYAISNFYPPADLAYGARLAPHAQCVATHFGRGRVAGFTDSTVWSTFSATLPGKPELMLGLLEWLNRRNRFVDPYPFARALLLLVAAAAFAAAWARPASGGFAAALALAGLLAGTRLSDLSSSRAYPPPAPMRPMSRVFFLEDTTTYELGSWGFVRRPERSYSVFFQWVSRLGYFPFALGADEGVPDDARAVVAVAGAHALDARSVLRLDGALRRKTPVLLLIQSDASPALGGFLERHGLTLRPAARRRSLSLRSSDHARWNVHWEARQVIGRGEALLQGDSGQVVFCKAPRDPLYVFIGSEQFCDDAMGQDQGHVPDPDLRRQFELEFSLIRGLVDGGLESQLRDGATRPARVRTGGSTLPSKEADRPGGRGHG